MGDPPKDKYIISFNVSSKDEERVYILSAVNVTYKDIDSNIEPDEDSKKIAKIFGINMDNGPIRIQSLGSVDIQEMHGSMEDIDRFIDIYGSSEDSPTPDIMITDMTTYKIPKTGIGPTVIIQRPILRHIGGSTTELPPVTSSDSEYPCSIFNIQLLFTAEVITRK